VTISANSQEAIERALASVNGIIEDVQVGTIYRGVAKRITDYGAFVEILPGKMGLVHISKLDNKRVASVRDIVNEGDELDVKVVSIDDMGRINLSRKDALES